MTNTATQITFSAFKKQIVATLAVAVIATGAFATTTTHAEAGKNKHRIGAFVAGAIVGGALLAEAVWKLCCFWLFRRCISI